jgi:hypothetical protein
MTSPKDKNAPEREVVVKQDEQKPVPVEVMADAIVAISQGMKKVMAGPLNEKAIVLLIQHAAPPYRYGMQSKKVGTVEIKCVLEGIQGLERTYLKAKPGAKK